MVDKLVQVTSSELAKDYEHWSQLGVSGYENREMWEDHESFEGKHENFG